MSKARQLAKNTGIIAIGRLSTQFLTFLLLPIYTTALSTSEYGRLDLILIYVAIAAPLLTIQMEMAAFRHLIDARGDNKKIAVILSSSLAIVVVGLLLGVVALFIFNAIIAVDLVLQIVLLFISIGLVNYALQILRGLGRNGLYTVISLVTGITSAGLGIYFVIGLDKGVAGILNATIIANTIGLLVACSSMKIWRYIKRSSVSKREIRDLMGYSWPLTINHLGLWAINGLSRTAIVIMLGLSAAGIFAAASKFPLIYTALFGIFALAWTEAAALHIKSEDKDEFFTKVMDSMLRLYGFIAIAVVAVAGAVFPVLVASDFYEARQLIPILIAGSFFGSLVTFYGAVYLASKKTREVAKITILALILTLSITLIGIPIIGVYAAAVALLVTYTLIAVKRHFDIQKYVAIRYSWRIIGLLSSVAAIVVCLYYLNNLQASVAAVLIATVSAVYANRSSARALRSMIAGRSAKLRRSK